MAEIGRHCCKYATSERLYMSGPNFRPVSFCLNQGRRAQQERRIKHPLNIHNGSTPVPMQRAGKGVFREP